MRIKLKAHQQAQPIEERVIRLQVIIVSVVVFIVMLGVGIVAPILPSYAKSFTGSYTLAGLVISIFGLARLIFDIPSGTLSDKFGRRPTIIGGIIIFSFGGLLSGLAIDYYTLLAARFLQGLGASVYTTSAMAYVADIVPLEKKGEYLAYYQGSFSLGVAVGPALGGFLVRPELGGIRGPFFILSGMAVISAIVAFTSLGRAGLQLTGSNVKSRTSVPLFSAALRMVGTRDVLIVNFGAIITFISISGIRGTAIPFYGIEGLGMDEAKVGVILGVSSIVNFLFIRRSGSLVDKIGSKKTMTYGFLSSAFSIYLFAYTWSFESMLMVSVLFGLSTSLMMSAVATSAVGVSEPSRRGFSLGIYRAFSDMGIISGPLLTGLLLEGFGFSSPFIGVSLLTLLLGILAAFLMKSG